MTVSIKNLIILLGDDAAFFSLSDQLSSLFPLLDATSDIYVVSEDLLRNAEKIKGIVKQVGDFLHGYSFYRINVHPFHPFSFSSSLRELYLALFGETHPFIQEAYLHQSISRLMILPIIKTEKETNEKALGEFFRFLRKRNFVPSIFLSEGTSSSFKRLLETDRERIYLSLGKGNSQEKVIRTLCAHFEFDDLLTWVNNLVKTELPVCRSIIFSERDKTFHACPLNSYAGKVFAAVSSKLLISEIENMLLVNREGRIFHYIEVLWKLKETLKANNRERERANVFFHLGLECIKRDEYAMALKQFEESLAFPGGVDDEGAVFLSKALCHLRLQDIEAAQVALNEAEQRNPSSAMVYYYRGHCEFALKDYIEAIDMFKKSLEMGAEQIPLGDVYFNMGLSHINILEYDEGLSMMREAEKFYNKDQLSPVIYYMGVCHFGKNDIDTAYKFFKKALTVNPTKEDLSSIYLYLGTCYKENGEYREAIEELKRARHAEEDRLEVYNLMGFCYYKLKKYDKAIECFLKAVELNPHSAIDWANLGVNVKAKGEDEKAVILFKKALSLDPTIGFAKKHLKDLLHKV